MVSATVKDGGPTLNFFCISVDAMKPLPLAIHGAELAMAEYVIPKRAECA